MQEVTMNSVEVKILMITPADAADMLSRNPLNRNISASQISFLCDEILADRWKFTGTTIVISDKENILDGQHRLEACIKTGVNIISLVVFGVNESAFNAIDTGKPRSLADVLTIGGEVSTAKLAGALQYVHKYKTDQMFLKQRVVRNTEVPEVLKLYPGLQDAVRFGSQEKSYLKEIMPIGAFTGLYWLFCEKDEELAQTFMQRVSRGIGEREESPAHVLRKRLIKASQREAWQMDTVGLSTLQMGALCVNAWNKTRMGEDCTVLRWVAKGGKHEFPKII